MEPWTCRPSPRWSWRTSTPCRCGRLKWQCLLASVQDYNYKLQYTPFNFTARVDRMDEVEDMDKFVPWFLECNPGRFPYWFGTLDPRNKDLYIGLKHFFTENK